ncbi:TPA: hypothetical protein ACX6QR_000823 [Photobacterium damselae]
MMKTSFDDARALIELSIQSCFGRDLVIMTSDGQPKTIRGYIKTQSVDGHQVKRLLTVSCLPTLSTIMLEGKRYSLSLSSPEQGKGQRDSQIQNVYILNLTQAGIKHDFSEF